MENQEIQEIDKESLQMLYNQLCTSYHSVDDFRAKLLGFLPLASGAAILTLMDGNDDGKFSSYLSEIGLLGALITFGLLIFELKGIQKCTFYIAFGAQIEQTLLKQTSLNGQFMGLDLRKCASRFFTEPVASAIVYASVMGAWVYVASATKIISTNGSEVYVGSMGLTLGIGVAVFSLVIIFWKLLSKPVKTPKKKSSQKG